MEGERKETLRVDARMCRGAEMASCTKRHDLGKKRSRRVEVGGGGRSEARSRHGRGAEKQEDTEIKITTVERQVIPEGS